MEEVIEALGIDKVNTNGNLIFIEEHHHSNANFVLHAITSNYYRKSDIVCFILFHNTFGQCCSVGKKLGYHFENDSNVRVIEPWKIVAKNIHTKMSDRAFLEFDLETANSNLIKQLARVIKSEYYSINKARDPQNVCIIIDDLSHLFDIGLNAQDIWLFIRYLRSFVNTNPLLTLCISSHVYKTVEDSCQPNVIAHRLRYFAELVIIVKPLDMGHSKTVSGKMIVCWKSENERLKFKWPEEMVYLYKLYDRQVKLFTPGSLHLM